MTQNNYTGPFLGSFGDPSNWSKGHVPTSSEDAQIGNNGVVDISSDETVNSIGTGSSGGLGINSGSVFTVEDGTGPNANDGTIIVFKSDFEVLGGTLDNPGIIALSGDNAADAGALLVTSANGTVTLDGGGSVEMAIGGGPGANLITGLNFSQVPTLLNVDNTISGDGTIGGEIAFTNEIAGVIETNDNTSGESGTLAIWGSAGGGALPGSFVNDGKVIAQDGGTVEFGKDGQAGTITNNAAIDLALSDGSTAAEIAGNVTISSPNSASISTNFIKLIGSTDQKAITSDGNAATLTLSNQVLKGAGTVGDTHLTLNVGAGSTIDADVPGQTLVLDTGNNTITNQGVLETGGPLEGGKGILLVLSNVNNSGGTIEATDNGIIDFGGTVNNSGGTVELTTGGTVEFNSPVTGGTVDVGAGSKLIFDFSGKTSGDVTFTGPSATVQVSGPGQVGGTIVGAAASDSIDVGFVSFAARENAVWQQTGGSDGTLSLYDNGADLASFNLAGSFNSLDFTVSKDVNGLALITVQNTPPIRGEPRQQRRMDSRRRPMGGERRAGLASIRLQRRRHRRLDRRRHRRRPLVQPVKRRHRRMAIVKHPVVEQRRSRPPSRQLSDLGCRRFQ